MNAATDAPTSTAFVMVQGKRIFITVPALDVSLPDPWLYEYCRRHVEDTLTQMGVTVPQDLQAGGRLCRGTGNTYVRGNGWAIIHYSSEFQQHFRDTAQRGDWKKISTMFHFDHYWDVPSTPLVFPKETDYTLKVQQILNRTEYSQPSL